jgi:dihydroorotate dehydrogenase electron transfer subunit
LKIERVESESTEITSLFFKDQQIMEAKPGQYVMVWVPGVDEVPMSISAIDVNGLSRITVRIMGYTTNILTSIKPGEILGIRGPFGNSYNLKSKNSLIVAGGSGIASLMPLIEQLSKKRVKQTLVLGARSADQLLFVNQLEQLNKDNLLITTDDGSKGYSGYASGYASKLMEMNDFDMVYTCGPELMMAKVFNVAEKNVIPIQASLERYIKCALGLCGACAIGPYRVCMDGPIFDSTMLREVREEFGIYRKDSSGRKIRVDH